MLVLVHGFYYISITNHEEVIIPVTLNPLWSLHEANVFECLPLVRAKELKSVLAVVIFKHATVGNFPVGVGWIKLAI